MKSYSLTVGRLYILPSIKLAFHNIYFLPKDESYLFEIWDAMFNSVYLSNFFPRIGKPSLGHHNTTFKAGKDGMQVCGYHPDAQIPNVDGGSFESHQRCLLPSPLRVSVWDCPTDVEGLSGQGSWAACECRMRGTLMMTLDLWLDSSED